MKIFRSAACLFVILFWGGLGSAINAQSFLPPGLQNGLVEWLGLDGNAADSSGNGNDGTITAGAFVQDRFGAATNALHFSGTTDQHLVVQDSPSLHTPFMTTALWFRSDTIAVQQIAFKGVFSPSNPTPQWSVYIDPSGPYMVFAIRRNGVLYFTVSTNKLVLTNQWQFAAASWDGTNQIVYLNGQQAGRTTSAPQGPIDPDPASDQLVLGHANTQPVPFVGDLDDFALYNRALSPVEINQLYNLGTNPPTNGIAKAVARVDAGFVVEINVVDPGFGYTNTPIVRLIGGGGTGAEAIANVTNGTVASISVENPGHGYVNAPVVQVDPPTQSPPYPLPVDLQNGLVEWLPFNGYVTDVSGNGNNGTLTDGSFDSDRFGASDAALHFSGQSDQHLVIEDSPSLHTPYMSAAFWFRSGINAEQQLVFKGLFNPNNAFPQWSIFIDTLLSPKTTLAFAIKRNGSLQYVLSRSSLAFTNQWRFATATWDGTNQTLYLDGEEVGQTVSPTPGAIDPDPPSDQLVFGLANIAPFPFVGDIDDFKLYNRALSSNEVSLLFQVGNPGQATAAATVTNGLVSGITILIPGYGYTNVPLVTLVGGGGAGAQAIAFITNGMVTSIEILSPGIGYTNAPTVQIDPPPAPAPPTSLVVTVKTVHVEMHVYTGRRYVLEVSQDLETWSPVGDKFVATSNVVGQDFDVSQSRTFFRIRDVTYP